MSRERTNAPETRNEAASPEVGGVAGGGPTRRVFVGVFPPTEALADLARVVDGLQVSQGDNAGAQLTLRDGWHLTLAFLGPVPVDHLADAASALDRTAAAAAVDRTAAAPAADGGGPGDHHSPPGVHSGLVVRLAGGGSFGGAGHQILWVGVHGDVAGLVRLADTVRRELAAVGLTSDGRDFRAHLTITRPGVRISSATISADLETLADYVGPEWTPLELCLVASETALTEFGRRSRYTTLHRAPLTFG